MISELVFRYLDYFYLVKDKTILVIIKDDNDHYDDVKDGGSESFSLGGFLGGDEDSDDE